MYYLNTSFPTLVSEEYIVDPSIIENLLTDTDKKRQKEYYEYTDKYNPYLHFIRDITSGFLELNNFEHNKEKWYMDVIRYNLK